MRFLSVFLAVALLATAISARRPRWTELSEEYTFEQYKQHFGKRYSGAEDEERKDIFENNLRTILAHNAEDSSYRMGVNHMTDWTVAELKSLRGYNKALGQFQVKERARKAAAGLLEYPSFTSTAPPSVDWRGKGILSAVKDQGQCGSCWSFASAETIESAWAISTGQLNVLSEQHILSCVPNPQQCGGTGGCAGGTAELAFTGLMSTGITSEWIYPYLSWYGNNSVCKWDNATMGPAAATWSSFVVLPSNDADSLMSAVAAHGPIAVSVDATVWHLYESGIFNGCDQVNPDIDHAVQLVGYGTDSMTNQDYWIIRNSWTPEFGEEGFIRILKQSTPTCGTDVTPLDGTACAGDTAPVTVCGTCGVLYDSSYVVV